MATSIIKTNNKGFVSVTGNGSKTRAQLFNELFALVDMSKVTEKTMLNTNGNVFSMTAKGDTALNFAFPQTASIGLAVEQVTMSANSVIYYGIASSSGYTMTDESSTVIPNGYVIKLIY